MELRPVLGLAVVAATLVVIPVAGSGAVIAMPDAPGSASASLHGNHVIVGAQISADGTVVAEEAATLGTGFLVLRRDDGGEPGEPLGHTVLQGTTIQMDVGITVDEAAWSEWSGPRTVWAVVHLDDGDGEFDLGSDPSAARRYATASQAFELARGDAPVRILASQTDPIDLRNGTVTIRRVDLDGAGYVVAHPLDDDRVVGTKALTAGSHENVSLRLAASFLAEEDRRFRVRLAVYRDDGNGEFDTDDRPVTVGEERVESDVVVRQIDDDATTTQPLIITPSPTTTPETRSAKTANSGTQGASAVASSGATATDATGSGFGLGLVLAAIVAVAVIVADAGYRR
jgi:hypothetical protein